MENQENIIKQLQDMAANPCNNYCKYPLIYDPEKNDNVELCESEICANCPLTKLL